MSYSFDANILLYASDESSEFHARAQVFLNDRKEDSDILCLTWPVLMAFQRIATHPSIFSNPMSAETAWGNVQQLLKLPRARVIQETASFALYYAEVSKSAGIYGNLVPDAHIATILRQHGVRRFYTADTDFKKFAFLEVVNPLA
ncbi:MAG: PIN domain-containing protein [Verrucomicrobia bacterium]|nr:PIN domain-containing protein [Verrucomicrobiota bacterium]